MLYGLPIFNLDEVRMVKTVWSFGRSECSRIKLNEYTLEVEAIMPFQFCLPPQWRQLSKEKITPVEA